MSNPLDSRELLAMLPREDVPAKDIRVGDIIDNDFGPELVGKVKVNDDGTITILDNFDCGCTNHKPDRVISRVKPRVLLKKQVQFLLDRREALNASYP